MRRRNKYWIPKDEWVKLHHPENYEAYLFNKKNGKKFDKPEDLGDASFPEDYPFFEPH